MNIASTLQLTQPSFYPFHCPCMPLDITHPTFTCPDSQTKIWRYMDFAKFLSLITTSSLHFSNLTVLSKEDPYEGVYNDHPRFMSLFSHKKQQYGLFGLRKKSGLLDNLEGIRPFFVSKSKNNRNRFFINCWHINFQNSNRGTNCRVGT
jgi:hypothetical protein